MSSRRGRASVCVCPSLHTPDKRRPLLLASSLWCNAQVRLRSAPPAFVERASKMTGRQLVRKPAELTKRSPAQGDRGDFVCDGACCRARRRIRDGAIIQSLVAPHLLLRFCGQPPHALR